MKRYQIIYSKQGFPLCTWSNDTDAAREIAERLRRVGYTVDVWEHDAESARKVDL